MVLLQIRRLFYETAPPGKLVYAIITCILLISFSSIGNAANADYLQSKPQSETTDISNLSNAVVSLAHLNKENDMYVVNDPIIVNDGRDMHKLSSDILAADTRTLLHEVIHSEYIRIARTSAKLLSSHVASLPVHYDQFNGYAELLNRSDFENVLLSYAEGATDEEKEILREMLLRNDLQNKLFVPAFQQATSLCNTHNHSSYNAITASNNTTNMYGPFGIIYTFATRITFIGGQTVNAYAASREYTAEEQTEMDAQANFSNLSITLLAPSDVSYNCHSYAWYRMNTNNPYWVGLRSIGDDGFILGDEMFVPSSATIVDTPQVMDIAVYYDQNNRILHSAVIVDLDSDSVVVQSKWGAYGLYRHPLDTVPQDYTGSDGVLRIKFYRYHNYIRTTLDLGHMLFTHVYQHVDTCTICGHEVTTTTSVTCSGPPCVVPFSQYPDEAR